MSLLATIITRVTFIAYPGTVYSGENLLVPGIMFDIVVALVGRVINPFLRHAMSVYEYFGKRFGRFARMYTSFTFAVRPFLQDPGRSEIGDRLFVSLLICGLPLLNG
jgi:solute:Na+ symporter, SSS family